MIRVEPRPAPENFDEKVGAPARAFLRKTPSPGIEELRNRPYWRNILDDLYVTYGKVCAYSALWCTRDGATVDHFLPAVENPQRAYDWNNFRLASRSMNSEKRDFQDVVDPFIIAPGSFVMEFPSLMIKSGPDLTPSDAEKINKTINRLKLNKKEKYINYRREWLCAYCDGDISFAFLNERAPFIAYELNRQKLKDNISDIMNCS